MNLRDQTEAGWSRRSHKPLAVDVQRGNLVMVVLLRLATAQLIVEAVGDRSERIRLVAAKSDIQVERKGVVVAVLRYLGGCALEMSKVRLEQSSVPLVTCVVATISRTM